MVNLILERLGLYDVNDGWKLRTVNKVYNSTLVILWDGVVLCKLRTYNLIRTPSWYTRIGIDEICN